MTGERDAATGLIAHEVHDKIGRLDGHQPSLEVAQAFAEYLAKRLEESGALAAWHAEVQGNWLCDVDAAEAYIKEAFAAVSHETARDDEERLLLGEAQTHMNAAVQSLRDWRARRS